jgi:hypothetical protein
LNSCQKILGPECKISNFLFFILFVFLLYGCKKNETNAPIKNKYESYFGLIAGRYIIYDVREVYHDENAVIKHDTLAYQLKTVVGDTILDNTGRIARKFLRYKRINLTQNWVLSDVWTTIIDGNYAELTEENQRIIKLFFPVSSKTTWNANVFNCWACK